MTHGGLEQLRSELQCAETTLRRLMDDPELVRQLAHGPTGLAGLWRGLKQAQAETDFLRAILNTYGR
jgi:hypothetical protein